MHCLLLDHYAEIVDDICAWVEAMEKNDLTKGWPPRLPHEATLLTLLLGYIILSRHACNSPFKTHLDIVLC